MISKCNEEERQSFRRNEGPLKQKSATSLKAFSLRLSFPPQMNEAQWFFLCGRLNEHVCITCSVDDLMST